MAPLPVVHEGLQHVIIFREPLYLAVAIDPTLAQKEHIEASDLAGVELLALGPDHQLRDLVVNLATQVRAEVRFDYEGTSLDTREMMATGLGSFLAFLTLPEFTWYE